MLEGHLWKSHLTGSLQIRHPAVCVAKYKRDIRQGNRDTDVKFRGDKFKCSHIRQSDTTHVACRSRPSCSADEGEGGKPVQITRALRSGRGTRIRPCYMFFLSLFSR